MTKVVQYTYSLIEKEGKKDYDLTTSPHLPQRRRQDPSLH